MKLYLKRICAILLLAAVVFYFGQIGNVIAAIGSSLSSDNFRVLDPQHSGFGGTSSSSSTSFRMLGVLGDLGIGSSSATSFGLRSGFLYFPSVVAPTLTSATAGDSQVTLIWLAAEAFQGLSVSSYNVCTKPDAGAYTCQDVGAVLTYIKTGLTNGTSYTFKIEAVDAVGSVIATSNELSATPVASATPTPTPVGGGGGGYVTASVILSGFAYPAANVQILRDGQLVGTAYARANGNFSFTNSGLGGGTYKYSLFAIDTDQRRSAMISFFVTVPTGTTKTVDSIVIPPTLALANDQLTRADTLSALGQAYPSSRLDFEILPEGTPISGTTDSSGRFTLQYPLNNVATGLHALRVRETLTNGLQSVFSSQVGFGVNVPFKKRLFDIPNCGSIEQPDLNCDGRVNIVDVSILMYWFRNSALPPYARYVDFNGDGTVNIVEFSIMVFYWTG